MSSDNYQFATFTLYANVFCSDLHKQVMREIEKSILETIDKGEAVPFKGVRVTQGTNLSLNFVMIV